MPAFAGMTNMSASFCRHSGESRNREHHSKMKHLILNEYISPPWKAALPFWRDHGFPTRLTKLVLDD